MLKFRIHILSGTFKIVKPKTKRRYLLSYVEQHKTYCVQNPIPLSLILKNEL